MMHHRTIAACRAAQFAAGVLGLTVAVAVLPACAEQAQQPPATGSRDNSSTLSKQLDQSGGVIHPPQNVDPGMTKPAPALGSHSTPVIPPPGTPGGNPAVKPK